MGWKFNLVVITVAVPMIAVGLAWFSDVAVPDNVHEDDLWKYKFIDGFIKLHIKLKGLGEMVRIQPDRPSPFSRWITSTLAHMLFTGSPRSLPDDPGLKVRDDVFSSVPVRVYEPTETSEMSARPCILYFHGGGFVLFSVDTYDFMTREMAKRTGAIVISVDYRLAPQHPYPAAVDDSLAVLRYVHANSQSLNIDKTQLMVAGDSAGGNLAAVLSQKEPKKIRMQILLYPWLQMVDFLLPSSQEQLNYHVMEGGLPMRFLSEYTLQYNGQSTKHWRHVLRNNHTSIKLKRSKVMKYVNTTELLPRHLIKTQFRSLPPGNFEHSPIAKKISKNLKNPSMSPLLAESLSGLPPAYIVTAGYDPLRDEGIMYAQRLLNADVKVKLRHYPLAFHAFIMYFRGPLALRIANQALDELFQFVNVQIHDWQNPDAIPKDDPIPKGKVPTRKFAGDKSKCPYLSGKKRKP